MAHFLGGHREGDDQRRDGRESSGRRDRSHTTERTFNTAASRSRDDSGEDRDEMESASSRRRRYLRDGLSEVYSPEYRNWLHTYESDSSRTSEQPCAEMFAGGQSSIPAKAGHTGNHKDYPYVWMETVENRVEKNQQKDMAMVELYTAETLYMVPKVEKKNQWLKTPEGEEVSEHGDGRYNVFEPEGEPTG